MNGKHQCPGTSENLQRRWQQRHRSEVQDWQRHVGTKVPSPPRERKAQKWSPWQQTKHTVSMVTNKGTYHFVNDEVAVDAHHYDSYHPNDDSHDSTIKKKRRQLCFRNIIFNFGTSVHTWMYVCLHVHIFGLEYGIHVFVTVRMHFYACKYKNAYLCTYLHIVPFLAHDSFCASGKQDWQDREG